MQTAFIDTDLLRTFVAVCDCGSFRAAAQRVHRTPSAVSMQMAKLEDQVEAPLFDKDGRSVSINETGMEFLGYARRILSLHEEALARFHRPELKGLIRFGIPDDYELRLLTSILPRFVRRCPDVEIEIVHKSSPALYDDVLANKLDLAFVEASALGGQSAGDTVHAEPLVWFGVVNGLAKTKKPLPLALPGKSCYWRHTALDALERAGIEYRMAFTSQYSNGQVAAVMADLAVSPLPASCYANGLERLHSGDGFPELGTISVELGVSSDADETALALADTIRETIERPAGLTPASRSRAVAQPAAGIA